MEKNVKKSKRQEVPGIEVFFQKLAPAKAYINNIDPAMELNFEKIAEIMRDITGTTIDENKIAQFSEVSDQLSEVLRNIHQLINNRGLKVRIKKFRKKLQKTPKDDIGSSSDETSGGYSTDSKT